MKFPKVKVQPHWLAALQRALVVMPHCRWVCTAVSRGIESEIEEEICNVVRAAIHPWDFVSNWHFHETDMQLPNLKDYRIAWLNHMIEQCRAMQGKPCFTNGASV